MVTCYITDELLKKYGIDSDGLDDVITSESNPALWRAFMEGIVIAWLAETEIQRAKSTEKRSAVPRRGSCT